MKLIFHKYHGTGNDFILLDARSGRHMPDKSVIEMLCNRRFGIGADGVITLHDASGFDFEMKYFNSDGNESTMCGNGGRCIVAFADFLSLQGNSYRFLAVDGIHKGIILDKARDEYTIELSMNDVSDIRRFENDLVLDTGSPHLVRFVDDVHNLDVVSEGRLVRNREEFHPGGVNANFVKDEGESIFVRTYERGVEDETLSCGTGVTASALAYAKKSNIAEGTVSIATRGGLLKLKFKSSANGFSDIRLIGPAKKVFKGEIDI